LGISHDASRGFLFYRAADRRFKFLIYFEWSDGNDTKKLGLVVAKISTRILLNYYLTFIAYSYLLKARFIQRLDEAL